VAADRAVAEATVKTSANEQKARPWAGLFFARRVAGGRPDRRPRGWLWTELEQLGLPV